MLSSSIMTASGAFRQHPGPKINIHHYKGGSIPSKTLGMMFLGRLSLGMSLVVPQALPPGVGPWISMALWREALGSHLVGLMVGQPLSH